MELLLLVLFSFLVFAVVQDIRFKEISDWLNASLFIIGVFYVLNLSISSGNYSLVIYSLLVSLILFGFGSLLYYTKSFGGGDVKLLTALGPYLVILHYNMIMSFDFIWLSISFFVFSLFIFGFFYALIFSIYLVIKKPEGFKKEFSKVWKEYRILFLFLLLFFIIIGFNSDLEGIKWFSFFGAFLVLSSLFLQSVEKKHFIQMLNPRELRVGDWLTKPIRIKNKLISVRADGLSKEEILLLIKRGKKVEIKSGIAFAPAFILAMLFMVFLISKGLLQAWLTALSFS